MVVQRPGIVAGPLRIWHVTSENLSQLNDLRRLDGDPVGD
jgi:hypothetical protein